MKHEETSLFRTRALTMGLVGGKVGGTGGSIDERDRGQKVNKHDMIIISFISVHFHERMTISRPIGNNSHSKLSPFKRYNRKCGQKETGSTSWGPEVQPAVSCT